MCYLCGEDMPTVALPETSGSATVYRTHFDHTLLNFFRTYLFDVKPDLFYEGRS